MRFQHSNAYAFFRFRSTIAPVVQFTSNIWFLFLLGGILLGALQLVAVAVALYAFAVLFQLVTLPVEFDASRRAKRQLKDMGIVATTEAGGVNSVLKAASWTYVAGALAAVAMLLYYLALLEPLANARGQTPTGLTLHRSRGIQLKRRSAITSPRRPTRPIASAAGSANSDSPSR